MIKRSLITALVLLLGYHFILPHIPKGYLWIPGQQRANYARAQKFVHDSPADSKVVVGSSMANELSQEILGPEIVKLTFPAGGSFTGLDIIRDTGKKPSVLLIETNTLLRGSDEGLVGDVTSAWRRQLRAATPALKEEGRPSNYAVGFLNGWVKRFCNLGNKLTGKGKAPAAAVEAPADPGLLENVMRVNRETLNRKPDPAKLADTVRRFGEQIDALAAAGTRCVFFEMPINSSLQELEEPAAVRHAMQQRFPRNRYTWIDIPHRDYHTSDGIHLVREDADEVTRKIVEAAGK
ncbi:MAG: hypothetical protein EOP88_08460 [Verrucomicrobiaceae bacterium]|nr:MAG: hypothetical protein EOP88_08460 [Verrucomicrobiaceae bacterium]